MKNKISTLLTLVCLFTFFATTAQNDKIWSISTKSEKAKMSFSQALERLWNSDLEAYQKKLDESLAEDPNFFMAHANSAFVQFPMDKDKSQKMLDKALALPQDNLTPPEKIVRKALVNLKENNMDGIKANIDEMVNAFPDNLQSYQFAMGLSRNVVNDHEMGFKYAQKAIEINPDNGPAWNQLGYYYMDQDKMDKAEEAFNNYLRLNPNEANAHDSYGDFCMKQGKYDEARTHYEKAVDMGMTASRERAEKARAMAQSGTGDQD